MANITTAKSTLQDMFLVPNLDWVQPRTKDICWNPPVWVHGPSLEPKTSVGIHLYGYTAPSLEPKASVGILLYGYTRTRPDVLFHFKSNKDAHFHM